MYHHETAITVEEWLAILARHDYNCALCGATPEALTIDHVVPLYRGGAHVAGNIQPLCRSCNGSKGARLPDWIVEEGL